MESNTRSRSVACSPYRVPAPSPKDPAVGSLEMQPALVVFVLLVIGGIILFFRENQNSEHDGGGVASPMSAFDTSYGQTTHAGLFGDGHRARQHARAGRPR